MTPLPPPLGSGEVVFWRLDQAQFASQWDSGDGSFRAGGRWNRRGTRAVYAALDPATAILEVAVHVGFAALDRVAHVLTSARLTDPRRARVVPPGAVPEQNWLRPGLVSAGQQAFGNGLLAAHDLVLMPSVVSAHSWTMVFDPSRATGLYALLEQEAFTLDPRLSLP